MVVDFKNDLGSRQHQLSGIGTHDLALLSDSPFHEETTRTEDAGSSASVIQKGSVGSLRFLLRQPGQGMVSHLAAFDSRRTNLDGANPTWFCETGLDRGFEPSIHCDGGDRVGW